MLHPNGRSRLPLGAPTAGVTSPGRTHDAPTTWYPGVSTEAEQRVPPWRGEDEVLEEHFGELWAIPLLRGLGFLGPPTTHLSSGSGGIWWRRRDFWPAIVIQLVPLIIRFQSPRSSASPEIFGALTETVTLTCVGVNLVV